jgi:hypothetical protein
MRMRSISKPEVLVSGGSLGLSLMAAIGGAAGVGIITYYTLAKTCAGIGPNPAELFRAKCG